MKEFIFALLASSAISTFVSMLIGMVWYGPFFGSAWMKVMGVHFNSKEEMKQAQKGMWLTYLLQSLVTFILFGVFALVNAFIGPLTVGGSVLFALVLWFGFVMPIQAGQALWSGKSKKLAWHMFLISVFYQMICFAVGGLVWVYISTYFLS